MKLSIIMMVKNEAKYLERCLSSLEPIRKAVASELIIVDTGSEDDTVEIAKRFTDKVYFHQWNDNFSEMRNITISYAKGEWLFVIDGDEIVEDCHYFIEFLNSKKNKQYNSGTVKIKNITSEDDEASYAVFLAPRIFRRDKDFHFTGAIHNQPKYKAPTLEMNITLNHYGYIATDQELMEKKFKRTSAILKSELEKDPENIYYLYQLSVSYGMYQKHEEALEAIYQAYNLVKDNKLGFKNKMYVYTHLAKTLLNNHKFKEVEEICLEAIQERDIYLDLHFFLAHAQRMLYKNHEAIKNYKIYLERLKEYDNSLGKSDTTVIQYTMGRAEEAYLTLCALYQKEKDYENALFYALKIENKKMLLQNFVNIINIYSYLKRYDDLKEYYQGKLKQQSENKKIVFIKKIEEHRLRLEEPEEKFSLTRVFSDGHTPYATLNKVRLNLLNREENLEIDETIISAIHEVDFKEMPNYYGDIIYYLLVKKSNLAQVFHNLRETDFNKFFQYLQEQYSDLSIRIADYLQQVEINNHQLDNLRINKALTRYLLIIDKAEQQQYKEWFKNYLKIGIAYSNKIYSRSIIESELIYDVKNEEEAFFIFMTLAEENKDKEIEYVRYLRKALKVYPPMKKGIGVLLEELQGKNPAPNKGLEQYQNQVKENIKSLINQGELHKAEEIIKQLEEIDKNDIDIYSMKAVIFVAQGNIDKAEAIIQEGLLINPNNFDLLYNLGFVYEQNNDWINAHQCYKKAQENAGNDGEIADINLALERTFSNLPEPCLHVGRRAKSYKVNINEISYVKKEFIFNDVGQDCFAKEKEANILFSKHSWMTSWTGSNSNWFMREYFLNEKRLDIIAPNLSKIERKQIAGKILSSILDMYITGFAHRDIHSRNVYYNNGNIKLVDFETIIEYSPDQKPSFFNSYDITGKGLESPFMTGNMGFTSEHPLSISKILNITLDEAVEELRNIILEELRVESLTFKKRSGRHSTAAKRIYSSFTLPNFIAESTIAQRNNTLRFKKFKIGENQFINKTILDLGSNIGGMLFEAQKFKPKKSLGIEYDGSKVETAKRVAAFSGLLNINFEQGDIDLLEIETVGGKYDIVFCLAVEAHVKDTNRLYKFLGQVTNELLLFEGNSTTDINKVKAELLNAGFKKIELLGVCDDDYLEVNNCRPILKAWK